MTALDQMPGATISRRLLAERVVRDNGPGELAPPDEPPPDDSAAFPPSAGGVLVTLADVTPERVSWLWPGRLPAGKLVTLDGDPALGKSTLAITLASHLSTGRRWPDGTACPLADVVILSAEDGMADTIRPRLDAAGGDPARVHCLTAVRAVTEDGEITTRPPTLADLTPIREVIERTKARLLVIDVLMAYLPGKVDSHRDQDVRAVLHRIAEIADSTGCTMLLLRHLNKSGAGSPMYRGGGSIGIVGAARAGYVVAPDPDDETGAVRVLACVKSNLAEQPPSLTYRLESAPGSHVARVVWGEASPHSAADLLRTGGAEDDRSDRDAAVEWLTGYLTDLGGAAPAAQVMKAARADGINETTLKRARHRAGVTSQRSGFPARAMWSYDPVGSQSGQSGQRLRAGLTGPTGDPTGRGNEGDRSWLPTSAATGATPPRDTDPPAEPVTDDASPMTVSESPAVAASEIPGDSYTSSDTDRRASVSTHSDDDMQTAEDLLRAELGAERMETTS